MGNSWRAHPVALARKFDIAAPVADVPGRAEQLNGLTRPTDLPDLVVSEHLDLYVIGIAFEKRSSVSVSWVNDIRAGANCHRIVGRLARVEA